MEFGDDPAVRSERIAMRLTPYALGLLREAASLAHQDLSGFVLGAALEHARMVLVRDKALSIQLAQIAEDPERYERDPRIPEDPDLAAFVLAALRRREVRMAAAGRW